MTMERARRPKGIAGPRSLLSAFRIAALVSATLEATLAPGEIGFGIPVVAPILGATAYTVFKLAHPLRWYQSSLGSIALTALDLALGFALIVISSQIHMPFALYTLAPVLTSALLLPPRATVVTAVATLAYYAAVFFSFPLPEALGNLTGIFGMYVAAIALIATVPYIMNSYAGRRIQSRAMLDERLKIGREMHDGLCQTIYGLQYQMESLRREAAHHDERTRLALARMERLIAEAEAEARSSLESLRGSHGDVPFLSQLEESLTHFGRETGISPRLEAEDGEPGFDELVKLQALYICEEALRNVAKHSGAHHVLVRVGAANGRVSIRIADDGRGLDSSATSPGHGLSVMKERAESVGGSLKVSSDAGTGTEVQVEVPRRCPLEAAAKPR